MGEGHVFWVADDYDRKQSVVRIVLRFEMLRNVFFRYRFRNVFRSLGEQHPKFRDVMEWPVAKTTFVILFTPRSGSSHLHALMRETGRMGNPGEVFNPPLARGIATAIGARRAVDYVDRLRRARNVGGFFGAEVTQPHIMAIFGTPRKFLDVVKPNRVIWLVREDIIAQAVSISAMRQTGISHSVLANSDEIEAAKKKFQYQPNEIRRALQMMLWSERKSEAMFAKFGLSPLRLSYEQVVGQPQRVVLEKLAGFLGVEKFEPEDGVAGHTKIGGASNQEFIERFKSENSKWVARIEKQRQSMLDRLDRDWEQL
jgi:LPS sulfotransferase NodH